ncbi:isochorismatase family protein [Conyzicola nivalis]|uniref:Hydrolase n=1 Tax=Conyzicola nivalis TaxID=1477021 RepID=A0A916WMT2_9MICO|nr:isochorismatase family cysteine hydrolase [Conyzicola nivalis]GGB13215.1 hydrolase [Conyzicola nivalis]
MAISTIDPNTALIVVDLQAGTVRNPTVHPVEGVVANAVALLAAFRARGLPVVIANVDGTAAGRSEYGGKASVWPAEMSALVPQVVPAADEIVVTRRAWSVFAGTGLAARLADIGVTQVVIVGLATSFGVESTARDAYDAGYNVVVAIDAITDMRAEAHENSVLRVFPILGETATTVEIVAVLEAQ